MSDTATRILSIDDPGACGLGDGERCCAFLAMGAGAGFACGRTIPGVRETIIARLAIGTMAAKYDPGAVPFPHCQEARP